MRRIAKDGLPFDIDTVGELQNGEVEIIQFLRPDGQRRRMSAFVGEDIAKIAENQILSAEQLVTGEIAIYSRLVGEPDEKEIVEIAENGPGENSPTNVLKKLIEKKDAGGIKWPKNQRNPKKSTLKI